MQQELDDIFVLRNPRIASCGESVRNRSYGRRQPTRSRIRIRPKVMWVSKIASRRMRALFPGFVNFGREGNLHVWALCEDPRGSLWSQPAVGTHTWHSGYSSGWSKTRNALPILIVRDQHLHFVHQTKDKHVEIILTTLNNRVYYLPTSNWQILKCLCFIYVTSR
jgi:hypothetical protein